MPIQCSFTDHSLFAPRRSVALLLAVLLAANAVVAQTVDWEDVTGGLSQVSIGSAGVWGVNRDHSIFYRTYTYGRQCSHGSDWHKTDGEDLAHSRLEACICSVVRT